MSVPAQVLDLLLDALRSLLSRTGRSLLTLSGILLGSASLVATAGLAASAQENVTRTFDTYQATQAVARAQYPSGGAPQKALDRVRTMPGVLRAAEFKLYRNSLGRVEDARSGTEISADVVSTTPDSFAVSDSRVAPGVAFEPVHEERSARVALVGATVAARMSTVDPAALPTITIGGARFTVIGVIADSPRRPSALAEVVILDGAAEALGAHPQTWELVAVADARNVQTVGANLSLAADPMNDRRWSVAIPPSPDALREQVSRDLAGLYLMLAAMSVLIGALAIGNTMSISVMERTPEIGARRALGMTRLSVSCLFAVEAVVLGFTGGLVGAGMGALVVLGVDISRGWPYVVPGGLLWAAPAIGAVTGLVGGLVPAIRAGRLSPASAVRA